ncbi:hypothetical protein Ocin01_05428 [Orchesella cincta]|uniref:Uncharacterized protein n=1 Tax=Orchesella cincta TaxID=48709 RepID=A0A1D2N7P0_ORCCI|nr:hypothetical protein Ocin01_05428 [Orchesella cincta]
MDSSQKSSAISISASAVSSPRTAFGVRSTMKPQSSSTAATPRRQHARREIGLPIPATKQPAIKVPPLVSENNNNNHYSDDEDWTGAGSSFSRRYRGGGDFFALPLECLSRAEIKDSIKHAKLIPYGFGDDDEENKEEAEDQMNTVIGPDRARFNVWKGQNYDLHVLDYKSDFEKRVKAFQRPDMESILMDPFCRDENGLEDEPARADAFVIWKNKSKRIGSVKSSKKLVEEKNRPYDVSTSSDSDEESCCSTSSVEDPEIKEYIKSQKIKRKQGLNVTGETLYYDEDFNIIRNLHRDSYSMTNYGTMPDEKCIGKAHIFYPEMTLAEKNLLQPMELDREAKNIPPKKKSSKTISAKPPRGKGQNDPSAAGKKYSGPNKESGDFVAQII